MITIIAIITITIIAIIYYYYYYYYFYYFKATVAQPAVKAQDICLQDKHAGGQAMRDAMQKDFEEGGEGPAGCVGLFWSAWPTKLNDCSLHLEEP